MFINRSTDNRSNWVITLNQGSDNEKELIVNWQENDADLLFLCILLIQLKYQIIEQVIITNKEGSYHLLISYNSLNNQSMLLSVSSKKTHISIPDSVLDYILVFLLKRIRHGIADVDHIDLEFFNKSECLNLTIKLQGCLDPVSEVEALRRLGL